MSTVGAGLLIAASTVIRIKETSSKLQDSQQPTANVQIDIPDLKEMSPLCQDLCNEYKVAMIAIADIQDGNFLEHPYALRSITASVIDNTLIAMDELKIAEGQESFDQCLYTCTIETDESMFPVRRDI